MLLAMVVYLARANFTNRDLSTSGGGDENMSAVTSLGLGKTMEKKLHSSEGLTKIGSKQAVFRLKELYPNTFIT